MKVVETVVNGVLITETVLEDSDFATAELREQRLSICRGCEFYSINTDAPEQFQQENCSKCSCILATRVSYTESFCPEGKW